MRLDAVLTQRQRALGDPLGHATFDGNQRGARLASGDRGPESREGLEVMLTVLRRVFRRQGDGRPDVFAAARHIECGRHDTDYRVRRAVDLDDAIHRASIAVEVAQPQPVTDEGDVRVAADVLVRRERTADEGTRAKDGEVVRAHATTGDHLGHVAEAHRDAGLQDGGGDVIEGRNPTIGEKLRRRRVGDLTTSRGIDGDDAVGIRVREGPERDGVEGAEYGGGGTDA